MAKRMSAAAGGTRRVPVRAITLSALLVQILLWCTKLEPARRDLDSVELFGGDMAITRGMFDLGCKSVSFDKKYYPSDKEDFLTRAGFTRALALTLRIKPGGSLWGAPVCSSWGWIGRSTTKRNAHMPWGDLFNPSVKRSNRMVVLLVMLFLLSVSRGVHVWLEQPASTIMKFFTPMKEFLETYMYEQQVWPKSYGSKTMKPLSIWSSSEAVHGLKRYKPRPGVRLSKPARCGGTTGIAKELKESSAYPAAFGKAVAMLMKTIAR